MVIPYPMQVRKLMKSVPEGLVITLYEIRAALARESGTDISCPMSVRIFTSIVAQASHEDKEEQGSFSVAYWRSLKRNAELNPKFPGGIEGPSQAPGNRRPLDNSPLKEGLREKLRRLSI